MWDAALNRVRLGELGSRLGFRAWGHQLKTHNGNTSKTYKTSTNNRDSDNRMS